MKVFSRYEDPDVFLSIIVPVYNVSQYVEQFLNSLISSPLENIEFVVVNDGSDDNTSDIVKQWFISNNVDGCFLSIPNQGAGKARNIGIEHARGKYITFMDGDDICLPSAYIEVINCLKTFQLDLVVMRPQSFNHQTLRPFAFPNTEIFDDILKDKIFKVFSLAMEPRIAKLEVSPVIKIINKNFWMSNNISFSEGVYFEDLYPHVKIMLANPRIGLLNYLVFKYRVGREGQITSTFGEKRKDFIKVLNTTVDEIIKKSPQDSLGENILAVLLRMGIWCAEHIEYNKRKDFFNNFLLCINRLPEEWLLNYEKSNHSNYWEKSICIAVINNDVNLLIDISEGNFDYHKLKSSFQGLKSLERNNESSINVIENYSVDRINFSSKFKIVVKRKIISSRNYLLRFYDLIKKGY